MKKILITGGIRSGKSRYALDLALKIKGKRIFLATAEPLDKVIQRRIKYHQNERNDEFLTMEEPLYLSQALQKLKKYPKVKVVVIDCLTLWVNNLFYHFKKDNEKIQREIELFSSAVTNFQIQVIIVTNEIGMGIIPSNELARDFIDTLGFLNKNLAKTCDEVVLMLSGIAHVIKTKN